MTPRSLLRLRLIGALALLASLILRPPRVIQFLSFDSAFTHVAARLLVWVAWSGLFILSTCLIVLARQIAAHRYRLATIGISLSFAIILSSVLIILFYPFDWASSYVDDSQLHHKVIPSRHYRLQEPNYQTLAELSNRQSTYTNFIETNAYGFLHRMSRQPTKKIVLLGDSFTEGAYVQANFATVLQTTISSRYSDDIEVINFGLGSYSPLIEFNVLKDDVLPLKPAIVILSLDMTDVHDDYVYSKQLIQHESGDYTFEVRPPPSLQSGIGRALYFNAKLFAGILDSSYDMAKAGAKAVRGFARLALNGEKELQTRAAALDWSIKEKVRYKRSISGQVDLDPVYAYPYKDESEFLEHLRYTFANIIRIDRLARANDITFLLHIYPHSVQIDTGYECYRDSVGLDKNVLYSQRMLDETFRFAAENSIPLISSIAALKSAETRPYYECDMHFNRTGHAIAAGVIYSALAEKGLLDRLVKPDRKH